MDQTKFKEILEGAIHGNQSDIEKILRLYRRLIDGNSYLNGKLDEDLRQYITMHIIKNISKFKI